MSGGPSGALRRFSREWSAFQSGPTRRGCVVGSSSPEGAGLAGRFPDWFEDRFADWFEVRFSGRFGAGLRRTAAGIRCFRCARTARQSPSSRWKTASTALPKQRAIFSASTVEGTNFPLSMALIVCRLTPVASASCCWVMRISARATLILFFIVRIFFEHVQANAENYRKQHREGYKFA